MKKVIGMLALIALVGNIANAELLKNFKYDGKITINAATTNNELDANSDAKDNTSGVDPRVELNAGFDLTQDVGAVVSAVKCTRQYGDGSETVAAGTADGFAMEQAYLDLKGVLGFDHKVGRQYYGNEGDLIVYYGPRNMPYAFGGVSNGLGVTGLDGYTGWYNTGKWSIHGLLGKVTNAAAVQPDTDTNLSGVGAKYDLMEQVKLAAYVYEQKTNVAASADLTLDVVGVKANGNFKGFDYSAELAKNYGRKAVGVTYTGTGFKANLAYNGLELAGKLHLMGEFVMGSGDKTSASKDEGFTAIVSDYRPGIVFGGVSGMTGINNLTAFNVGANWMPTAAEKLTVGAKAYMFGTTETVGAAPNDYDAYGNEFDVTANWQHNENVGLLAYYGAFMVDSDYSDAVLGGKDDMISTLGLALNVKF